MSKLYHYSIILPTRNEPENIPELLSRINKSLGDDYSYEVIFVDDSSDHTPEIIKACTKNNVDCRLIHRIAHERTGLATAFIRGFKEARGEYIVCMDSDLQHPPEVLPSILKKIKGKHTDIVVASRYMSGGSAKGLGGLYRRAVSIVCKYISYLMLAPTRKTTDPGSGFFAFKKEIINDVDLAPKGFKILIELLVKVPQATVQDVPYVFQARTNNESKATVKQGLAFFSHLGQLSMQHPEASRLIRFSFVGLSGVVVNLGLLYVLVDIFSFSHRGAWFIAVAAAIVSNFILNTVFTFPELRHVSFNETVNRFMSFVTLSICTSAVNYAIYSALLNHGTYYLLAAGLGIIVAVWLNYALSKYVVWKKPRQIFAIATAGFLLYQFVVLLTTLTPTQGILITLSLFLTIQGFFSVFLMLYSWEDPQRMKYDKSPERYLKPTYSFTALIPARHEESVIAQTIQAVAAIDYPEQLKEIIVICRSDDEATITAAEKAIQSLPHTNIRLSIFSGLPINKPHALNHALPEATKQIVTIFDAEDQPHANIYQIINTVYLERQVDVVQSGVQLMNYDHNWYSLFNVLEYFFWFKSSLHFFAKAGVIPLGGNTVFFRKSLLEEVGGWDETCLTEDADIGIRLSVQGAKTAVVYDELHVTHEETPPTLGSFIKQRTRWNQGYIQILLKGEWARLRGFKRILLSLYILIWPVIQALLFVYLPFAIFIAFTVKVPAYIALITNIPIYVFLFSLVINVIGAYEFCKSYQKRFRWWLPLQLVLLHLAYQLTLGLSAFRALARMMAKNLSWEKTEHRNAHRVPRYQYD